LKPNSEETNSIFSVPLDFLLGDSRSESHLIERYSERHIVPVYYDEGYRIWGLTAMILLEFMQHGVGVVISEESG